MSRPAELATGRDGNFLGLRVKTLANLGAYLSTFASAVPTYLYGTLLAGQYETPAIYVRGRRRRSRNTAPVDAVSRRGPPGGDLCGRAAGGVRPRARLEVDPAEIRRRNFVQPERSRTQTPVALAYDSRRLRAQPGQGAEDRRRRRLPARRAGRGSARAASAASATRATSRRAGSRRRALAGALGARRGPVRERRGARDPTGIGHCLHRLAQLTARATRRLSPRSSPPNSASRSSMSRSSTATPDACRSARAPMAPASLAVGGSARRCGRQGDRQRQEDRRPPAGGQRQPTSSSTKASSRSRAHQHASRTWGDVALTAYVPHNFPPTGLEPGLENGVLRPDELHLPRRLAHLRSRRSTPIPAR